MLNTLHYIESGAILKSPEEQYSFRIVREFCESWQLGKEHFELNTSGSTGSPKSIQLTRAQMEASAQMTNQTLNLQKGDNALVCLNTSYIGGKMMLVRGMVSALNIYVVVPSSNPMLDIPKDLEIDFMAVVPLQMESMIKDGYTDRLNKLKAIIIGGAPISYSLSQRIKSLKCPVYATYGMTETVSHIALKRLTGNQAFEHYQILKGIETSQDDRGCLTIKGAVTNNKLITTNDLVKMHDGDTFEWIGRADNVINSGGIKIHPEQLENQVKTILNEQGIDCNLIIARIADASLGEKMVLILEIQELDIKILNSLKSSLKKSLPEYQEPKDIYCLELFDYTETGKVKRKETVNLISKVIP